MVDRGAMMIRRALPTLVLAIAAACGSNADGPSGGTGGGGGGGAAGTGGTGSGGTAGGAGGSNGGGATAGTGGGGAAGTGGGGTGGTGGGASGLISPQYPRDVGIASDPRVLFASDFENGLAGWTRYTTNTDQITVLTDAALAHAGTRFLRAQVTRSQLAATANISANAQLDFATRVPEVYWRFHARFVGQTASPHHWVRVGAGTPSYQSDGRANTVPPGNEGFWFDLDASQGKTFAFYAYWYKMRSGRCNDGSATPGCAGDQGTTYYYGNNFNPAGQAPFAADSWFCLEIHAKANTVGQSDGALTLWKDDALVGEYKPGTPRGRWLRDNFYSWGQYYLDEQAFEGFDFRSDADVLLKRVTLDAYYQVDTLPASAPAAQVILYDDVVIATSRIGCRVP
jgi:hypothetical protein